jgi:N-methylhydantoinase B
MTRNQPRSEIEMQVMWNRLISVVEEQARTLVRTAFGTATREAGDLSAGVYNRAGDMVAQAVTGTPGHINSMAKSVGHVLAKFPLDTMAPGDVFVTNDPWMGTGHLNDIVVVTPTFRGAEAVALFACTLHVVDIGGRGVPGAASQVYEEGLNLPIMKLVAQGRMNDPLIELVAANVREPIQVVGDIYSEVACNEIGGRRLLEMMAEYGLTDIEELSRYVLDRSRDASLEAIRALRFGTYRNTMTVDGIDKPLDLCATLTIGADGIDVDFTGTSGMSGKGINVPICYTEAYTSFGVKCIVAPRIPNNAASLATIRVTAPEGCILNAPHPAAVQARHIMGQMLPDVVFGCLRQAIPDGVPAEGTSCLWNVRLMGGLGRVDADPAVLRNATSFNITGFHSGGAGARPRQDGLSATAFPSGVRNVPVEITESMAPVLIHRKEFRTDSGGAGRFRGGLGQVMEIESAEDAPFAIATAFDRIDHPARGVEGGAPGMPGRVSTTKGRSLSGKGHYSIHPGEHLIVEMPGGGGYGAPLQRDPARVASDVRDERLSAEAAFAQYGVVLSFGFVVDVAATEQCRRARRDEGGLG